MTGKRQLRKAITTLSKKKKFDEEKAYDIVNVLPSSPETDVTAAVREQLSTPPIYFLVFFIRYRKQTD